MKELTKKSYKRILKKSKKMTLCDKKRIGRYKKGSDMNVSIYY